MLKAQLLGPGLTTPEPDKSHFHMEYAHNRATGPASIVQSRGPDEFILELRFSLQPYIRH